MPAFIHECLGRLKSLFRKRRMDREMAEELEFKSTLNHHEDQLSAVLEINAGAGGTAEQPAFTSSTRARRRPG